MIVGGVRIVDRINTSQSEQPALRAYQDVIARPGVHILELRKQEALGRAHDHLQQLISALRVELGLAGATRRELKLNESDRQIV